MGLRCAGYGSQHQEPHVDYARPLFAEAPDLPLPTYFLAVSFSLLPITQANGALEIAPGTQRRSRQQASAVSLRPVSLDVGDIWIRHPWALHRGTPNTTETPRPLVTIHFVRRWSALTPEQQRLLRFPLS